MAGSDQLTCAAGGHTVKRPLSTCKKPFRSRFAAALILKREECGSETLAVTQTCNRLPEHHSDSGQPYPTAFVMNTPPVLNDSLRVAETKSTPRSKVISKSLPREALST